VFVLHGTRRFLDRVGRPAVEAIEPSTTALGAWYATALFWKPASCVVRERAALLPVLAPFAPAATAVDRFPADLATVLEAHGVSRDFVDHELAEMSEHRLVKTKNRSFLGVMNEFVHLGNAYRQDDGVSDLITLSLCLPRRRVVLCSREM
jgi:hypothetical protein